MENALLERTLSALHTMDLSTRAMFGGIGLFSQGTMFGLIAHNQLHLKSHPESEAFFHTWRMTPYVYYKKSFPVTTKYHKIPDCWWQDLACLQQAAQQALRLAQQEKLQKSTTKPNRLKDLPNLRFTNERMLRKVGIQTAEQLRQTGAINAYLALQQQQSVPLQPELILALEGAIQGLHWSVIPAQRKAELLTYCQ